MPYVYSTATCDTIFTSYRNSEPGQAGSVNRQVLIRGGANLAKGKAEFVTKYGVRTDVTDEQLAFLKTKVNFQKMVNAGFLRVDERKVDPEKVAADMTPRDESAPLVPQDYDDDSAVKPVVKESDEGGAKPLTGVEEHEEEDEDEA